MRKFFVVVICLICAAGVAGCASALDKREPNISELRDVVMKAESEAMRVDVIGGVREEPFAIDGSAGEKQPFTVITITPSSAAETAKFSYALTMGGAEYRGELSKHPFKSVWSAEIAAVPGSELTLVVTGEGKSETFKPASVIASDMISAEEALEIAERRLKARIKELTRGGKLCAEVYIRFMDNPISSDGGYYWYVAFVPNADTVYAALVHPVTGEIAAVRE